MTTIQLNFRRVAGFEDRYIVSDHGEVFSLRRGRLLKPYIHPQVGHVYVQFNWNGKSRYFRVSDLVLKAFVSNKVKKVRHKDGDKTNNHLSNLEIVA